MVNVKPIENLEKNHFVTWPVFYQNVVLQERNVIRWKNLTTAKRNFIMLQITKKTKKTPLS